MPIYAFACSACGHTFDRLQRLADPDPSTCPACGAEGAVGRQLTAPQFRLAGAGWYETDFKKDGDKKRNLADKADKAEGPAAPAPSASPAAESSAKPAAAAAAAPVVTAAPPTSTAVKAATP